MTSPDEFHDALAAIVPEPPQTPGRAAAARRLHRRRRNRMVGLGTAAAVLTVIAVPFALGGLSGPTLVKDRPATSPTSAPDAVEEFACPAPITEGALPVPTGGDALEEGPVAVRMCNPGGLPWQAPHDELTEDPGVLVDLVNTAPEQKSDPNRACTMDLGPTWGFLFGYPDGSTRFIRAEQHGCGGIFVGSGTRGHNGSATGLVDEFTRRLLAQRAEKAPPAPGPVVELGCTDPYMSGTRETSMMPLPTQVEFDRAVLCVPQDTGAGAREARISGADLSVLLDDLNARVTTTQRRTLEDCNEETLQIYGVTPWGDRKEVNGSCGEFTLDGIRFWQPGPQAAAILAALAAAAR